MRRFFLSLLFVIGLGLIVAPLSMSMFSRANDGQKMVNDFRPLMQPAHVQTTADYYYKTFVPLRTVAQAMNSQTVAKFNAYLQGIKGMEQDIAKMPPALIQQLGTQYPAMGAMLKGLPQMDKDFSGLLGLMSANLTTFKNVPGGLDWYLPLVTTMQQNTGTYASVDALPPFGTFPWFFVIPGLLVLFAAGYLLLIEWKPELSIRASFKPPTTPKPLAH
jgi:hypothetical protein